MGNELEYGDDYDRELEYGDDYDRETMAIVESLIECLDLDEDVNDPEFIPTESDRARCI